MESSIICHFCSFKIFPDEGRLKKLSNDLGKMVWFKIACMIKISFLFFHESKYYLNGIWSWPFKTCSGYLSETYIKLMCSLFLSAKHVLWSITSLICNEKRKLCHHWTSGPAVAMQCIMLPFMWSVIHNYAEAFTSKSFTYKTLWQELHFHFIPCTVFRKTSNSQKATHTILLR